MTKHLLLTACTMFAGHAHAESTESFDICVASENQFVDMVGGAAIGSTITASVAGQSVLLVIAEGGALLVTAPAVAGGVTTAALAAGTAYLTMKGFCNADKIGTATEALYQEAVRRSSDTIDVATEVHEIAVQQQSKDIEPGAKKVENVQNTLSDWFCSLDPKCR